MLKNGRPLSYDLPRPERFIENASFYTYGGQCQPAYLVAIAGLASKHYSKYPVVSRAVASPQKKMGAHGFSHTHPLPIFLHF
jgi:hypothetical protein